MNASWATPSSSADRSCGDSGCPIATISSRTEGGLLDNGGTGDELIVASALVPDQAEMPPDWHNELMAKARTDLEARIDALEGSSPPPHRSVILDGDPSDVITQIADDEDASLVVVGARGDGGFRGWVLAVWPTISPTTCTGLW